MQQLWLLKLDWNETLPPDVSTQWKNFIQTLKDIESIHVPRCFLVVPTKFVVLNGFADASSKAYGAVIYVQTNETTNQLLCSKSRLAPIKSMTIPRLELCSCLLLAKLIHKVKAALKMHINSVNLYSDSTIALSWINSPSNLLKTFVSNRVSLIQQLSRDFQWQHVPSELNPADLSSRGLDVKTLATSELWFNGPDFSKLSLPSHRTEQNSSDLTDKFYINELKPVPKLTLFFKNSKSTVKETGFLKQREYADAEKSLLKHVQVKYFTTEIAAIKREMSVPSTKYYHKRDFHVDPQALLNTFRLKYWPIGGRNIARKVVHECEECFRNKPVVVTQIMGDLPAERVTSSSTFLNVGIDLCGPFEIKYMGQRKGTFQKIYVALFVCMTTKAVHIEFVSDLTSEALIATLKRFFARRGKSSIIFSDNGTNLTGASAKIKRLYKLMIGNENISNMVSSEGITWKFSPRRRPNFGGLWESGVKSFKYHLKRVVGSVRLTLEEFSTVITQIEGILNSRPLSPLPTDTDDFQVLTPGHFLIGKPINSLPEPNLTERRDNLLNRWQRVQKMMQTI
ncbi:integrase catalytic domain-containing protein [Trichonephila clavipes]|nr:integrase catalytic domain-containing protein [Trichonephila clavipes]